MARTKSTKRKKGDHSAENMLRAIRLKREGMSLRKAAKECNVHYPTLFRYYKKNMNISDTELTNQRLTPHYDVNRVFTSEQETELKRYILDCAAKFYGLSSKDVRSVAYQMAQINNIKCPESWQSEKLAGVEWLRSFRSRHPELSLKKPEACSLARATAFNRESVKSFFNNLRNVMDRHPAFGNGCRVYNLDETGTSTVQKPQKVLAPKGRRNLCKITSGEKGTLVTTCAIVCATGQYLPPVLVFPRKNYKDHMLHGAPAGSLGLATPSGWMNTDLFVKVMEHFIKHACASPENPALLIMDNHESHLSIDALDLAKKSGVTILTLHPHTTAKMQPLDVGLNGPFKTYYNSAVDSWLRRNPGKQMSIYNIAECVGQAYHKAMTPVNIIAAFKKCGIFPFDADVFDELDFLPSDVTDREQPGTSSELGASVTVTNREQPGPSSERSASRTAADKEQPRQTLELPANSSTDQLRQLEDIDSLSDVTNAESITSRNPGSPSLLAVDEPNFEDVSVQISKPQTESVEKFSQDLGVPTQNLTLISTREVTPPSDDTRVAAGSSKNTGNFVSPKEFMLPLKAGPRTGQRKPRKLGKSMIATDTPEKNQIFEEKSKAKKRKTAAAKVKRPVMCDKIKNKCKKTKFQKGQSDTETSEEEDTVICQSESDLSDIDEDDGEDLDEGFLLVDGNFKKLDQKPLEGDYVMVYFETKKLEIYYVALITEIISDKTYVASFMRVKNKSEMKFYMPLEPDLSEIRITDIKMILPKPKINGTKNRNSTYVFPLRVSPKLNLR